MVITKPEYFDRFQCLAGACPDSCCKEWSVQVDPEKAEYYRSLPGALGDRLRQVLQTQEGETVMTIEDGRCPMWRTDGLCRIQAELGEQALCTTCRECPRLTHDYGDFRELGLELSCPEAARYILASPAPAFLTETFPGAEEGDYDEEAMSILKTSREAVRNLLADTRRPIGQALALVLLYGCQVQGWLDGGEEPEFDSDAALETAEQMAKPGNMEKILDFFRSLELLTQRWAERLAHPCPGPWDSRTLALARYLVDRYWLQAVSDYDVYSRVKWIAVVCLVLRQLGGDFPTTAQLFSKEIENDADNLDAILDAAYTHPAFTDDKLLFLLLA